LRRAVAFFAAGGAGRAESQRLDWYTTYEVLLQYCPGFLLVGDDSGGRGFLIDIKDEAGRVYGSVLGDLDPSEFHMIASTLQDWVDSGLGV